jgi:hypothetical protein
MWNKLSATVAPASFAHYSVRTDAPPAPSPICHIDPRHGVRSDGQGPQICG